MSVTLRTFVRLALGSLSLLSLGCSGTAPPPAPAAPPADNGPPPVVAAPLPDPSEALLAVVAQAERALSAEDGDALLDMDRQLYEASALLSPAHPAVAKAQALRQRIKAELVPLYGKLAEQSFKAGRYDDAFRQVGYIPDSASKELVATKRRILAKKPGIEKQRAACAKTWTLRACKLHEQHPTWSLKLCKSLYEEMVGLDMVPEMVRISWGEPKTVERQESPGKLQVVWTYGKGATIVFDGTKDDDLKVTEVQN